MSLNLGLGFGSVLRFSKCPSVVDSCYFYRLGADLNVWFVLRICLYILQHHPSSDLQKALTAGHCWVTDPSLSLIQHQMRHLLDGHCNQQHLCLDEDEAHFLFLFLLLLCHQELGSCFRCFLFFFKCSIPPRPPPPFEISWDTVQRFVPIKINYHIFGGSPLPSPLEGYWS